MVDPKDDRQKFSQLLAFYVNGTLDTQDTEWMVAYLDSHSEAQAELKFVQLLRETSKNTISAVPESERLERLLSTWSQAAPSTSMLQKCIKWLKNSIQIPAITIPITAVLMLGQAVVIGTLFSVNHEEEVYRSERTECEIVPTLKVVFNPDAKHVEILLLLRKVEASIQNGPSETGELWIAVSKGRSLEEVQVMLRSSSLVDEAIFTKEVRTPSGCVR